MRKHAGFTLIELLITLAVIGVLAIVVLFIINPLEQLAKSRDGSRKVGVVQIGHAIQAYNLSHNGANPPNYNFLQDLITSGDLKAPPPQINGSTNCWTPIIPQQNNYCYYFDNVGNNYLYTPLESETEITKCNGVTNPIVNDTRTFYVYFINQGKACISCGTLSGIVFYCNITSQ